MSDRSSVVAQATPFYRVLLCASGMSPAIVTETLYALITRPEPFLPHEIHIITTTTGKKEIERQLFQRRLDTQGQAQPTPVEALLADHWPVGVPRPRFGADTLHLIDDFEDVNSVEANEAAGDCMFNTFLQLQRGQGLQRDAAHAQQAVQIHASIAGGRKTMSFLMGHAFSLLAAPQDELSHVLVNSPFEFVQPPFYFKPKTPHPVTYSDRAKNETTTLSTADAHIELGLIPALKLGQASWMPLHWQNGTTLAHRMGLSAAVRLFNAQNQPEPLELTVVQSKSDPELLQGRVHVCGVAIDLPFVEFAWLVIYALLKQNAKHVPNGEWLDPKQLSAAFWDDLPEGFSSKRRNATPPQFASDRSDLEKSLRNHIGHAAQHYALKTDGTRTKGQRNPYHLVTPVHLIRFLDGDEPGWESDWWVLLRKHFDKLQLTVVRNTSDSTKLQGRVHVCGVAIDLPFVEFAWLVIYALLKQNAKHVPDGEWLDPNDFNADFWDALPDDFSFKCRTHTKPQLASDHSDLEKSLRKHIGNAAHHYALKTDGTRTKGQRNPYHLVTPVHLIRFLDGDEPGWESDWWVLLRKHLKADKTAQ